MDEIELSVMVHTPATAETLQSLLADFQSQNRIKVNLTCLDWVTARAELNKAALYHHGPDVSEVGSTWVPDLISMNVLHPLLPNELNVAGKSAEFVGAAWSTVQMPDDPLPWAIPWHAETYVIHYRKDLLQKAGVDEATAFKTHADIEQTAAKLAKIGVPAPVELTLQTDRYGTLHALASWVWGNAGEFLSADSKNILLNQPKALEAIKAYYGLLRHINAEGRAAMLAKDTTPLFHTGQAAVTFGTMRMAMPEGNVPQEVTDNWGWAPLPQPCFVGGSNLVVWKHTRNKKAAHKLVGFLTSPEILSRTNLKLATLAPRLSVLENPEYISDPMLKVMSTAIQTGRTYPPLKLWGLVEDRLVAALLSIGSDILSDPAGDVNKIIEDRIESVTQRIGMILSQ